MTTTIAEPNVHAEQWATLVDSLAGRRLPWVRHLRKKAIEEFVTLGFPTTKLENWRFTNVAPVQRTTFVSPPDRPNAAITDDVRQKIHSYAEPRLVFVNGRFDANLSGWLDEANSWLFTLSEALEDCRLATVAERHLGQYTQTAENAFAAWNTAFFTDGAFIEIPRGKVIETPVNLVFLATGTGEPWACHPRNLIVAGENSQVTIVETFLSSTSQPYLTNAVTEIAAESGAVIDYCKVEQESPQSFHFAAIDAHLALDASLRSHCFSFGGALVRNDLNVALDGEGSHCTLNGFFAVDGGRLVDNHTHVDHLRPHASSRELYKGVLADKAAGVFNGAISVREAAAKTDAVQYSKNLLLSSEARINTKPQLEIRNNDVRCFHGATIGQIDPEAAFYLRSRGIDETQARQILVRGFAAEVIETVPFAALCGKLERVLNHWYGEVFKAS
jgi:Fe-S cluster assembly protein SufD